MASIPRIVAIAGGKGGIGKSTVAANLALAFGRLGQRTLVVDGDFGAANLHTMFGVLRPEHTLAELVDERVEQLDEIATQVAPNVRLVPGTSRPGAANLKPMARLRVLRALAKADADLVLVDLGAGTSYSVIDVLAAADHKLLVLAPQLPALNNAYGLLKAFVHRAVRKLSADEMHRSLIDSALGQESKARTIPQLLGVLRPLDNQLADRIVALLHNFGVALVGNMVSADNETPVFERISKLCYEHLLVHAPVLAAVRRTSSLSGGLRAGASTVADRNDPSYTAFMQLALSIIDIDLAHLRGEERVTKQSTMPLWIQRELMSETAEK
jgi:flagellar biosynthesis protein FlhG